MSPFIMHRRDTFITRAPGPGSDADPLQTSGFEFKLEKSGSAREEWGREEELLGIEGIYRDEE